MEAACAVFLPAIGCRYESVVNQPNERCDYWSSTNKGPVCRQAGSFDETALGEVATFTVEPYTSAHAESETIPSGDEDYIENKSFKGEIRVEYRSDGEASVTGAPEGSVAFDGNRVTANVTINGGYICAITTGGGEWDGDDADPKDVSGAAGGQGGPGGNPGPGGGPGPGRP